MVTGSYKYYQLQKTHLESLLEPTLNFLSKKVVYRFKNMFQRKSPNWYFMIILLTD